jgi:C4-type Zn-finger protein
MTRSAEQAGRICPACGEGALQPQSELESVEYKGITGEIELRFAVCEACGSDLTGAADAHHNKCALSAFKKNVESF